MNNSTGFKAFGPVLLIFIFTTALFIVGKSTFTGWGIDINVLLIGNVLLFLAATVGFYLYTRSMNSKNPHAIVRTVYGSIMAKMMIVLIAALIYISSYGKEVNKGAVFACMFLYFLYTFVEVAILMKLSKQKKHV